MPFSRDGLPVYSGGGDLLYYASFQAVERLIKEQKVRPVGTRARVRKVVAMRGMDDELRAARPRSGEKYSDLWETRDNPRGVWHFKLSKSFAYGTS